MGTHPIFESDFDCLTDSPDLNTYPPWVSISDITRATTSAAHIDPPQSRRISTLASWSKRTVIWHVVPMLHLTKSSSSACLCPVSTDHQCQWLDWSVRWAPRPEPTKWLLSSVPSPTISEFWKSQNFVFVLFG